MTRQTGPRSSGGGTPESLELLTPAPPSSPELFPVFRGCSQNNGVVVGRGVNTPPGVTAKPPRHRYLVTTDLSACPESGRVEGWQDGQGPRWTSSTGRATRLGRPTVPTSATLRRTTTSSSRPRPISRAPRGRACGATDSSSGRRTAAGTPAGRGPRMGVTPCVTASPLWTPAAPSVRVLGPSVCVGPGSGRSDAPEGGLEGPRGRSCLALTVPRAGSESCTAGSMAMKVAGSRSVGDGEEGGGTEVLRG